MKMSRRWGTLLALAVWSVGAVQAQTTLGSAVQYILVGRQASYLQTGPSSLVADPNQPFVFSARVEGFNMSNSAPITSAAVTVPNQSSMAMSFNSQEKRWDFEDYEFSSMTELNSFYPVGDYVVTLHGTPNGFTTINVASFNSTQLQIPQVSLTGGTWMNGIYMITDMASLSVTFNSIYSGTIGSTQAFHYEASIGGGPNMQIGGNPSGFANNDPTGEGTPLAGSVPPVWNVGTLPMGIYSLQVGYDDVQNPGGHFNFSVFGASLLTYRTTVMIEVVPEPSTYASLALGLGLIGLAGWRRSRRA